MRAALARLSSRTGWTAGDVWTVGLGMTLAAALAITTVPAVLEDRGATRSSLGRPSPATSPRPVVVAPVPQPTPAVLSPGPAPAVPPVVFVPEPAEDPAPPRESPRPLAPVLLRGLVAGFAELPLEGSPGGLAVAGDGTVVAGTDAPGASPAPAALISWDDEGRLRSTSRVPSQPADRTRGLSAVDHAPNGDVLATDAATGRLLRRDTAGRWSVVARLPDLPTCVGPLLTPCQPGLTDTTPLPRGIAVDDRGDVYVSDAGQGTIWRLGVGAATPEPWYQSADVLGTEGLAGGAFLADGSLLVTVTRLSGLQATGAGALLRLARNSDGAVGARTTVADFPAGEDVVDIAVGASEFYVALRGSHAVAVLSRDGAESLRFIDDRLRNPTAVAVTRGRLLVTSSGGRPSVLQIGVEDRRAS